MPRKDDVECPPIYRKAFLTQRLQAARRGIEFRLTLREWLDWWGDDIDKRGVGSQDLCMMRPGDIGSYEFGNIVKGTCSQNHKDAKHLPPPPCDKEANSIRSKAWHAARIAAGESWHLSVRGDGHPKSKSVITPDGRFGSIALAAEHYGITRAAMHQRINNWKWKAAGFHYE